MLCNVLHFLRLHYTCAALAVAHYKTLQCIALSPPALHCIAVTCIALHCCTKNAHLCTTGTQECSEPSIFAMHFRVVNGALHKLPPSLSPSYQLCLLSMHCNALQSEFLSTVSTHFVSVVVAGLGLPQQHSKHGGTHHCHC